MGLNTPRAPGQNLTMKSVARYNVQKKSDCVLRLAVTHVAHRTWAGQ